MNHSPSGRVGPSGPERGQVHCQGAATLGCVRNPPRSLSRPTLPPRREGVATFFNQLESRTTSRREDIATLQEFTSMNRLDAATAGWRLAVY
jgi:hypothetical protein